MINLTYTILYYLNFVNFKTTRGKKVAIRNETNNNDWLIKGVNSSFDKRKPTNKLLEKSGDGNNSKPPISPIIIEKYAVFSLILLSKKL